MEEAPGTKHSFLFGYLDRAALLKVADVADLTECARCGMTTQAPEDPAAEAVCAFCRLQAWMVRLPVVDRQGHLRRGSGCCSRTSRRRYLITLERGRPHTHKGRLAHDELIGSAEGTVARTDLGQKLLVLRPTLADWVVKMPRGAQVIYPRCWP